MTRDFGASASSDAVLRFFVRAYALLIDPLTTSDGRFRIDMDEEDERILTALLASRKGTGAGNVSQGREDH